MFVDDLFKLGTPEGNLFPARTGLFADQLEGTRTSGLFGASNKCNCHTITGNETELIDRGLRHREGHGGIGRGTDNHNTARGRQWIKHILVLFAGLDISRQQLDPIIEATAADSKIIHEIRNIAC